MLHIDFSAVLRRSAAVLALCFFALPGVLPAEDGDGDWQETGRHVDTLRFRSSFFDSLKRANKVTTPCLPLRMLPEQCFSQGEELVYDVSWGPFKAGYVVLTAAPDSLTHTIKLGGKALSRGFVSTFYRMRDYVQSTIDADGFYPLFFEQHLREGKHFKADNWILYDHARDSVFVKDGKFMTLKAPRFTHDFISIMYYIRTRTFAPGDTFSVPVCVDKKIRYISVFCRKRDTVEVNGRNVACLDLLPRIIGDNGIFSKNASEVWVTDDALKVPVKIKSKIKVGSISAKLIYSSRPQPAKVAAAPRRDSGKMADSPKIRDSAKPAGSGHDLARLNDSSSPADGRKRDSGSGSLQGRDSMRRPAGDSFGPRNITPLPRHDSGKDSAPKP